MRARLQEAFAVIVTNIGTRQPLVLILEDLHRVDEASGAALRYLLGLIDPERLLVVVNRRMEMTWWPERAERLRETLDPN